MNRSELAELVHTCGHCNGTGPTNRCEVDAVDFFIVKRLWPVLAQVWEEGYETSSNWHILMHAGHVGEPLPNPYGQAPR